MISNAHSGTLAQQLPRSYYPSSTYPASPADFTPSCCMERSALPLRARSCGQLTQRQETDSLSAGQGQSSQYTKKARSNTYTCACRYIYIYTSRYGLWMIIIDNYGISWSSMVIPLLYIIVIGIPYLGQSVIPFWWWYDHQLLEHWIQGACVHVSLDLLHYCGDPTAWASAVYCRILQANRSFESIKRAAVATFDLL